MSLVDEGYDLLNSVMNLSRDSGIVSPQSSASPEPAIDSGVINDCNKTSTPGNNFVDDIPSREWPSKEGPQCSNGVSSHPDALSVEESSTDRTERDVSNHVDDSSSPTEKTDASHLKRYPSDLLLEDIDSTSSRYSERQNGLENSPSPFEDISQSNKKCSANKKGKELFGLSLGDR